MEDHVTHANMNPGYVDAAYLQRIVQLTRPIKQRSYELMDLHAGHYVLDVGCGAGIDTIPLAHIVGPTGRVVGIDYDTEMISTARQRAEEADVQSWVQHDRGDATALPYENDSFDRVRSERVFQHVADPTPVLAEMIRVTKSGGWVVVADTDHSSISIDCADRAIIDIEWRLRRCHAEKHLNGYAGRQLYRLFKNAGFSDIIVEVFPIPVTKYQQVRYFGAMEQTEARALTNGIVSEGEIQRWHVMLEDVDARGAFFGYIVMVLVAGRKS
jgi:ubiquinone/menaquinone biosynthesis C-methylase UbiE